MKIAIRLWQLLCLVFSAHGKAVCPMSFIRRLFLLFLVGLAVLLLPPSGRTATELPLVCVDPADWLPLYDCGDLRLQAQLESALNRKPAWKKLIKQKKMAVGLVDLSDMDTPRFARVNGRDMMYAASLPKIAILLAAFVGFEDGSLAETEEINEDLVAMIRFSSNDAATRMIDRIGFAKISSVLTDPRFMLYDKDRGGGLWIGKRYAKQGKRHPDPMQGISHAATVTQVCRFYYLLARGRILNPERSAQILDILGNPGLHHKFVARIQETVPLERIFRKSGTWKTWHSDSVLVWGEEVWQRYILVALVESEQGEAILRDLVPEVEKLLQPKANDPTKGETP
jgi:beta-lactamase class A